MKSEFIVQDMGGTNNADLVGARARVTRGGSWRPQRIIVIIPASEKIPAKVALSHWNLIFPPNNGVVRILALGQEVGSAYSNAIDSILANPELSKWEYILTVEHDNCPPADGVIKLLEDFEEHPEFSAIGGGYWTKGPGGVFQAWGDPKDPVLNFRPQLPDPNGKLIEVCGTAQGFTMFKLSMFKDPKMPRPFFKTETKNGVGTQDLMFWRNARPLGYRCAIDCSIKVGHYDLDGNVGGIPDHMW